MHKSQNTEKVEDDEILLRAIYSPSFFDEDGSLSPSAFELVVQSSGDPETGISVIRPVIEGYERFLQWIKDRPREKEDVFSGTVALIAKLVRDIRLKTTRTIQIEIIPTRRKCHAEIRLIIDGILVKAGCHEPEYLSFLRHLVDMVQDQIKLPA